MTGYSTMFVVALFWFLRRRKISLWQCFKPRWSDLPRGLTVVGVRSQVAKWLRRPVPVDGPTHDALIGGVE